MKKGLLILIPLVALAVWTSRPARVPAQQEIFSPPIEPQTPQEEAIETVALTVLPERIIQGEPILVTVSGLSGTSTIRAFKFKGESLPFFLDSAGRPAALIGIDLRYPPGTYPVTLTLTDGRVIQKNIVVNQRKIVTAPLGIPEKLGGNTPEAEKELVNTLVEEGKIISAIRTTDAKLWSDPFRFPVENVFITDVYGYGRETVGSTIAHKGTDFRAPVGTPIMSIGDGKVAYAGFLRNYGHVIAIDHGTRVLSLYMHLSKVEASIGEEVKKGQRIALSGDTGYVLGPHLHLTVRVGGISIDPMKFYELLGS